MKKTQWISHLKTKNMMPVCWLFFLIYAFLTVYYLNVSADEAKYLSVIKQVAEGRVPALTVHTGSAGEGFYFFNYLWSLMLPVGYINFRLLNVLFTTSSLILLYLGLTSLVKDPFSKVLFVCFFLLNPALVSFGVEVNPMAIAMACTLSALGLICFLYSDGAGRKSIYNLFPIGVLASFAVLTKIYCVLFLPFYFLVLLSQARKNSFFLAFGLFLSGFLLPFFLAKAIFGLSLIQVIITFRLEPIISHFNVLFPHLKLAWPSSPQFSPPRYHQSYLPHQPLRMNPPSEVVSPLIRQFFGYSANALNLLIFFFAGYAVLNLRKFSENKRNLIINLSVSILIIFSFMVAFKYVYYSAYAYLYYLMPLVCVVSILGASRLLSDKAGPRHDYRVLSVIIFVLALQNLVFIIPSRPKNNPTYTIYKQLILRKRNEVNQVSNIKAAAKLANSLLIKKGLIYDPEQFLVPYLNGNIIHGTEMNYYDHFFNKYSLKDQPVKSPTGVNAAYVAQAIKNRAFSLIVLTNLRNEYQITKLMKPYCLKKQYLGYKMYTLCQSNR